MNHSFGRAIHGFFALLGKNLFLSGTLVFPCEPACRTGRENSLGTNARGVKEYGSMPLALLNALRGTNSCLVARAVLAVKVAQS